MKHTPGPWAYSKSIGGQSFVYGPHGKPIATVRTDNPNRRNDGILIAAAPIGYQLAERVMECYSYCPESVRKLAKEFIAKAEGRE